MRGVMHKARLAPPPPPPPGVSVRQQQLLVFIDQQQQLFSRTPSVREMARAIGVGSTNWVHEILLTLERKGLIDRDIGEGIAGQFPRAMITLTVEGLAIARGS